MPPPQGRAHITQDARLARIRRDLTRLYEDTAVLSAPWHAAFGLARKSLELLDVYQSGDEDAARSAAEVIRRAWLATVTTAPKAYDYAVFASLIHEALDRRRRRHWALTKAAEWLQVGLWQRFGVAFLEEDTGLIAKMLAGCVPTKRGRRRRGAWSVPSIAARLIVNARERARGRAPRTVDLSLISLDIYLFMDLSDRDDESDIAKAVATACTRPPMSKRNRK